MTHKMTPLVFVMGAIRKPMPDTRYIFTYDLLMVEERFRKHCPDARIVAPARLLSHRFIMNEQGVATMIRHRGATVHGLIWEITEQEQTSLEDQLGLPSTTDRYGAFARGPHQEMIAVEFYAARNHRHGIAKDPMEVAQLLAVAEQWQFPESYLTQLARWSPGPVESEGMSLVE